MQGIALEDLPVLEMVPKEYANSPADTIEELEVKLHPKLAAACAQQGLDFWEFYYDGRIGGPPADCTFSEVCMHWYSRCHPPNKTVKSWFESGTLYTVVRKIESSVWRYGIKRPNWNELVRFYTALRSFSLDLGPEFTIRLDHTTGYNPRGWSEYSRTYLDGVFGFLVYYHSKHVLTVGFSLASQGRLLLQQVQLRHRRGNRFLYTFPKDRLLFVLEQFFTQFPELNICLIDGHSLVEESLSTYRTNHRNAVANREHAKVTLATHPNHAGGHIHREIAGLDETIKKLTEKIKHLENDAKRLSAFYNNIGNFVRGKGFTFHGITYYELRRPSS